MATDNILRSYGDVSRKEDVLGLVEILTAKENWFLTNLGKTTATDGVHITLTDTLRTAASAAVAESGDYTNLVRTTPSRLTNIVENIAIPFRVGRTQQMLAKHTGQNEKTRQIEKALADWGNAAEFDLVRSTATSGVSGTAPKMSGIIEAISKSTNTTAHSSGTVWSASILKALMKDNMDNSSGDVATDVFMGSFLRDATDDFTGNRSTTINIDAVDRKLIDHVDKYQTSFGVVNIHYHRYVQQSGDATGRVLAVNRDKLKIAYFERPRIDTGLARSGDYDSLAVIGKLTAEVRNQDSNWFATGFDID